ncbi:MAG: 23S rRNA (guanosine(2251)-2'-O)-methyltransferase RlmB [Alphaproteobacteria bacterium]|nr:23S rRNA (guanosine(2251)-2'-O)-methyltransferase RlmB [Alphaproteobacteria bacterium]
MVVETVCGFHVVEALLNRAPQRVLAVYLDKQRDDARARALRGLAARVGVSVHACGAETIEQRVAGERHQGVMAEVRPAPLRDEHDLSALIDDRERPVLILVLDGVQDPHNLGACLRTAEAAGADAVIVPRDRACAMTPAVRKVASGAADLMPVYRVVNLARCLERLKSAGVWVVGAAEGAPQSVFDTDLTGSLALVLGGEQSGLRRLTRGSCDTLAHIPTAGANTSLNVSVASGVCLFEALRQRHNAVSTAARREPG